MTPMPTIGMSVRAAALPLAVELAPAVVLALAMADTTALEAAAMSDEDAESTSLQSSVAMEDSSGQKTSRC